MKPIERIIRKKIYDSMGGMFRKVLDATHGIYVTSNRYKARPYEIRPIDILFWQYCRPLEIKLHETVQDL